MPLSLSLYLYLFLNTNRLCLFVFLSVSVSLYISEKHQDVIMLLSLHYTYTYGIIHKELYSHGVNRHLVLPFTDLLQQHCHVHAMASHIDHRVQLFGILCTLSLSYTALEYMFAVLLRFSVPVILFREERKRRLLYMHITILAYVTV